MAAGLVRGDPGDLRPGHEIHLAFRGLLPFRQGLVHGAGFRDDAVGEAPRRDAFPAAGPSVVASRLFAGAPFEHREEVEDPEARAVRPHAPLLVMSDVLSD